jgi:hypothetical protein
VDVVLLCPIFLDLKLPNPFQMSLSVDTAKLMVGSYPPKSEPHTWTTPSEDAPSGMIARGEYKVESLFTDDAFDSSKVDVVLLCPIFLDLKLPNPFQMFIFIVVCK